MSCCGSGSLSVGPGGEGNGGQRISDPPSSQPGTHQSTAPRRTLRRPGKKPGREERLRIQTLSESHVTAHFLETQPRHLWLMR